MTQSIWSNLRNFGSFHEISREGVPQEIMNSVTKNEVVSKEYLQEDGSMRKVVSVHIKTSTGLDLRPVVSTTSTKKVVEGESVDLSKCFLIRLHKAGEEKDIYRIEVNE